jgi:hypothetical protein
MKATLHLVTPRMLSQRYRTPRECHAARHAPSTSPDLMAHDTCL